MNENKSILNIKKQTIITLVVTLLAFNGWAFIQASEDPQAAEDSQQTESVYKEGSYKEDTYKEVARKGHPRRGPMPIGRLMDDLGISDDQRDKVRTVLREERNQMHALHSGVEDQVDAKRVETTAETRARLAEILTDEQLARYDEMLERTRLARQKKHGWHREI